MDSVFGLNAQCLDAHCMPCMLLSGYVAHSSTELHCFTILFLTFIFFMFCAYVGALWLPLDTDYSRRHYLAARLPQFPF